jgi:hypothetical protein
MSNSGTAKEATYYKDASLEPIQVMQKLMTKEQFLGFLVGNTIKYRLRAGHKEDAEKDLNKARQYSYWVYLLSTGADIDPVKDSVPDDYTYGGIV